MSKELTSQLKKEHAEIVKAFSQINTLGIGSIEGKALLFKTKESLLGHLKKEDEKLYPILKEVAKNDYELKRVLERFASEMSDITQSAIDFFDKYESNTDDLDFARDFGRLYSILGLRISREENILYAKYDQLKSSD